MSVCLPSGHNAHIDFVFPSLLFTVRRSNSPVLRVYVSSVPDLTSASSSLYRELLLPSRQRVIEAASALRTGKDFSGLDVQYWIKHFGVRHASASYLEHQRIALLR